MSTINGTGFYQFNYEVRQSTKLFPFYKKKLHVINSELKSLALAKLK